MDGFLARGRVNRRTLLAGSALAALGALTGVGAGGGVARAAQPVAATPRKARMTLPAPTGRFPVGTVSLRLVDRARTDPWAGAGPREVMVDVRHSGGTWRRDLTLSGSRHGTYADATSLIPQIARQLALPEETGTSLVGTVPTERAIRAQRAYLSAFFDRELRGLEDDGGLLDGPSPRYPEIVFL
jgi:hypothetical protein